MLLAGLAAFLYGSYQLGMDAWFLLRGVSIDGYVVGHSESLESRRTSPDSSIGTTSYTQVTIYRPTIRYQWPQENGEVYIHTSDIQFEGDEMDGYSIGSRVRIRILPEAPDKARLPGGFTHYLWAGIGFAAGLAALVLVSSLFFMHEALFGADLSKGISLFRSVNWYTMLAVLLIATLGLTQFHQRVIPWMGLQEFLALATGDIRLLPRLLAAQGAPEPGQPLNKAEQSVARIPLLGTAFASEALELAFILNDAASIKRYLAALAHPATRFNVQSPRVLAYAAEKDNVEYVKALLAYGIPPDTAILEGDEPIRRAARYNRTAAMEVLIAAGARTYYTDPPLIVSAIEGRSHDAVQLLVERTKVDLAWREQNTNHTLADLALIQGMVHTAEFLKGRGAPSSLPGFYKCAVTGDLKCLGRELPQSEWRNAVSRDTTLLHLAARHHQPLLARYLLASGSDPNAKIFIDGSPAYTPLIEAVLSGDMEIIRLLVKNPYTKLDLGDFRHNTPLAFAIQQNRWDIAELLIEAGANVNIQIMDDEGNTPLHIAAGSGDAKRVQWLLAKGADMQLTNYRQLPPRAVARSGEIVKLLER